MYECPQQQGIRVLDHPPPTPWQGVCFGIGVGYILGVHEGNLVSTRIVPILCFFVLFVLLGVVLGF